MSLYPVICTHHHYFMFIFAISVNPWPPQQPGEPGLGGPVDPVNPVDPIKPVDPVDPIKPVDPVEPVKPVIPCSVPGWLRLPDGRKLYLSEVGDWTWHKAEAKATEKKAKLAKIISADENEKLAQILSSCKSHLFIFNC